MLEGIVEANLLGLFLFSIRLEAGQTLLEVFVVVFNLLLVKMMLLFESLQSFPQFDDFSSSGDSILLLVDDILAKRLDDRLEAVLLVDILVSLQDLQLLQNLPFAIIKG